MFISKKKIKGKNYFYLEEKVSSKRFSVYLGNKVEDNLLDDAFDSLVQKIVLENLKQTQKNFKYESLELNELFLLEKLKFNQKLIKKFFPIEFESFKENEFIRYAQGSTSVEGNSLTLQEASLVINNNLSISGKKIDEIKEIENMLLTRQLSKKIKTINEKNIKKIHSLIMKGFDNKKPGEYREGPIFIIGSKTKPTNAKNIKTEINKLIDWLNKTKKHPVELASEFHVKFEEIHPFTDGNGRVGREILNIMLNNAGYPSAIINLENRQSYIIILERLQINKEYNKFSKFIYDCLKKRNQEIEQIIKENKKTIIKKLKFKFIN